MTLRLRAIVKLGGYMSNIFKTLLFMYCCIALISQAYGMEVKSEAIKSNKSIGLFKYYDPKLEGLIYANWGSRPFEYKWVTDVVDFKGKKVLDMGVGLPSEHNWYQYVINNLKPSFYSGIDNDPRMANETVKDYRFELVQMNMTKLNYPDKHFDVVLCISSLHGLDYLTFMASIKEAFRVLKNDGVLLITFDERWDKNLPYNQDRNWNALEQSIGTRSLVDNASVAFGMPQLLSLIKGYFVPYEDNLIINSPTLIKSKKRNIDLYSKQNRDRVLLNSGDVYNSSVSFAILKKKK